MLQSVEIFIIIVIVAGCVRVPTQEMSDARQAIKAAHEVHAQKQAPTALKLAEESLIQAEESLQAGYLARASRQALFAKEQAVKTHDLAVAFIRAKTVWQTVQSLGYRYEAQEWLMKAQQAALENDIESALSLTQQAYQKGELVLNEAYLETTKRLINQIVSHPLSTTQITILEAALVAYRQQEGEKSYHLITKLFE